MENEQQKTPATTIDQEWETYRSMVLDGLLPDDPALFQVLKGTFFAGALAGAELRDRNLTHTALQAQTEEMLKQALHDYEAGNSV